MYDWEIENIMKQYGYNIPCDIYTSICNTSPQICRVKYEPFNNTFEMWSKNGMYIKFQVYPNKC